MLLARWKRFIWDATTLPSLKSSLPEHFGIRLAEKEEHKALREAVIASFTLDTAWGDVFPHFRQRLEQQLDAVFTVPNLSALVLTHGPRVIGASLVNTELDAENHLVSGPCVTVEYRSRGYGTQLLHASLDLLKKEGVDRVVGLCKELAPAAKFVYPKFGAEVEDYDPEAALAAIA